MTKTALRSLSGRKLRTALTALAIVLGVAMVSGTFVLTDTISSTFNSIFTTSYKNTSVAIAGKEVVKDSASGTATIPASLLPKVRSVPGAAAAAGAIFDIKSNSDSAKLLDKNGKTITSPGGAPNFGWGIDTSQPRFNPLKLTAGRWAQRPNDVVIDVDTANKKHFHIGDTIGVSAQGPVRRFHISGLARFGSVSSIGGATFAVFQVPTAQALLHKQGQLDTIFMAAKPGVSDEALVRQVRPLLPATAAVQTGDQQAKSDAKDINAGSDFIQKFLLAFAIVALLVGSFVIFNTLSMTVAQRVRELATLRTLGASRRQVRRSVMLEGLIVGLLASIVGLLLGIALAKGLNGLFKALGVDLPSQGTVLKGRTIIISLVLGVGITMLATRSPARRAMRVPPIAAVREGATLPPSRLARHNLRNAIVVMVITVLALGLGLFAGGLSTLNTVLLVAVGCIGIFIAIALFSSRLVRPLVAIVGAPAARAGGIAGRLAGANSNRNPTRTARTAGALMIGLALIALVATLTSGLQASSRKSDERQTSASYVITSKTTYDPIDTGTGAAAAQATGVTTGSSVRGDTARAFGSNVQVAGLDPATIGRVYDHRWTKGSDAAVRSLGAGQALVDNKFASSHDLTRGSAFTLTTSAGKTLPVRVRAIYKKPFDPVVGTVQVSQQTFDATFPRPKNLVTFVDTRGGVTAQNTAALKQALAPFPDASVRTRTAWIDKRGLELRIILNLVYVLLALSVVISLFGMVNALVLTVFERTREIGMLRAVGMTRQQVRRMVRQESVITALIGTVLGLFLGIFVAAVITRALRHEDISFSLPVLTLVLFTIGTVIAGVLAAVLPARRATRLNVLKALQYE
jgi:putative ABC transport system permease protein